MARTKADDNRVDVSGEVKIAGNDVIKNINMINQCALTAARKASRARKLLAWGVGALAQSLAGQVSGSLCRGLMSYRLNEAGSFHARNEMKRGSFE